MKLYNRTYNLLKNKYKKTKLNLQNMKKKQLKKKVN